MRKAGSMMTVRSRLRPARKALLVLGGAAALVAGTLTVGGAAPAGAATSLPCDIYAAAGTPCVAAHSTTRALYAAYNGPLYQVKRGSDGTTTNIGTLAAGGYANAATRRWLRAYAERYGRLPDETRLSWPHPYVEDLLGNVRPSGPQAELFS